jgi:hypothetical protein
MIENGPGTTDEMILAFLQAELPSQRLRDRRRRV